MHACNSRLHSRLHLFVLQHLTQTSGFCFFLADISSFCSKIRTARPSCRSRSGSSTPRRTRSPSPQTSVHAVSRSTPPRMGVNSISFGSPRVRCTPVGRTCGEPNEITKNTHPKDILPFFSSGRHRLMKCWQGFRAPFCHSTSIARHASHITHRASRIAHRTLHSRLALCPGPWAWLMHVWSLKRTDHRLRG